MDAERIEAARRALLNGSADRASGRWQTLCSTPIGDARTCAYSADTFRADVALHALLHGLGLAPPLTRVLTHSSYPAGIQYSLVAHAEVRLTDALRYIKELEDPREKAAETARSESLPSGPMHESTKVASKFRHWRLVLADGAASLIVALAVSGVVTAIKPENVVLAGRRMLVTELDSEWTSMIAPPTKTVPLELQAKRRAVQATAPTNEALPRGDIGILGERPSFLHFCESAGQPTASYRLPFVIYAAHQMARSLAGGIDDAIVARLLPARVTRLLGAENKPMRVAGDGSLPLRVPAAEALREVSPAPPRNAPAMDPKRLEPFLSTATLRRLCLVYKRLQHLRLPFRGYRRELPSPEKCERAMRTLNSFDPEADAVPRAFERARGLSVPTADPLDEEARKRTRAFELFTRPHEQALQHPGDMAKYDAELQGAMDESWSLAPDSKVPLAMPSVFDFEYGGTDEKKEASSRAGAIRPVFVRAPPMRSRHLRRVDRKARDLVEVAEDEPASEDSGKESEADEEEEKLNKLVAEIAEEEREREEEKASAAEGSDKEPVKEDEQLNQREADSAEEPERCRVQPPDLSDPKKRRLFMRRARAIAAGAQVSANTRNAIWEKEHAKRARQWYAGLGREREKAFPRLKRLRRSEVPALYVGGIGVPAASLAGTLSRPVHGTPDAVANIERQLLNAFRDVKSYIIDEDEDAGASWRKAVGDAAEDGAAGEGAVPDASRVDPLPISDDT